MTAPETNRSIQATAENGGPAGNNPAAGTPPSPALRRRAKAKNHNIRVSPAVLDAAGKDGDALLGSLRASPGS